MLGGKLHSEMRLKNNRNTKEHKIQSQYLYVFVGYVDKRGKKRKRERKKENKKAESST